MQIKKIKLLTFSILATLATFGVVSCNIEKKQTQNEIDNNTKPATNNSDNQDNSNSNNNTNNNSDNNTGNDSTDSSNLTKRRKYIYDKNNKYYASADGLKGKELYDALFKIQQDHAFKSIGYNRLGEIYRDGFKDNYYEKDGNTLIDVYSENPNGEDTYNYYGLRGSNARKEGQGANKEHMIPQSWFRGDPGQSEIKADAQFVFPTDIFVNAMRSNYPHGKVEKEEAFENRYANGAPAVSKNGSKTGWTKDSYKAFEPINEFKGDIARAYFYFRVTYGLGIGLNGNSVFQDSIKTNILGIYKGFFDTYLQWDKVDPVDSFDVSRNNSVFKYNKIRNPFTDYPELIDSLLGKTTFKNKGILIKIEGGSVVNMVDSNQK